MKNLIIILFLCLLTACEYKEVPVRLSNRDILYVSSVYRDHYGGGRIPENYIQRFIISSSPRGNDTIMILEYAVPERNTPFKFNLGDTLHLNFKH